MTGWEGKDVPEPHRYWEEWTFGLFFEAFGQLFWGCWAIVLRTFGIQADAINFLVEFLTCSEASEPFGSGKLCRTYHSRSPVPLLPQEHLPLLSEVRPGAFVEMKTSYHQKGTW